MSTTIRESDQPVAAREFGKHATDLLDQQLWCWGRDILRPEGNWLLEINFDRVNAPAEHEECPSLYTLELPEGRRVVLRGFGVFFGDDRLGGIFLPRSEFRPRYTERAKLERRPWTPTDLPRFASPSDSQQDAYALLTLGLVNWLYAYEAQVAERLGVEYRRSTLERWDNGKRKVVPAEQMAAGWRSIGVAVAADIDTVIPPS